MQTFIIRRRGVWATEAEWQESAARSRRVCAEAMRGKVRWMRSYLVQEPDGRFGSVCLCRGLDPNAIREHAVRTDLPIDQILALPLALVTDAATPEQRRAA